MNLKPFLIATFIFFAAPTNAQTLTGPATAQPITKPIIQAPAQTTKTQAVQQNPKSQNAKEPLEITADNTLEWYRSKQRFIATGNALAVQGTSSVAGQTLTADYRDGPESGMEIHTLTADKTVILTSNESKAFGDHAIYKLDEGLATLTGEDLLMTSPDQTVTAEDKFEYWVEEGRINAIGDAVVIRPKPQGGQDKLEADIVSAILKDNAQGQRVLDILEGTGNVIITTPTEIATGNYVIYRADINKAELKGNVVITRGPNILKGERAEVDLNTDTSKIFGNPKQGSRVSGTFYPGSN